ncbi:hypothetical protein PXH69_31780 [Rhodococcus qingshengii]|uniref:Uncharacterized protein n=1 Tax=Rhodococcus qingshengii TaxID=334542 RepID=A0AAW6LUI9_RHOSG|nr:hypothetical protein [Rhodococcus qingshengii]MDE8649558.1 hypothetical protein [Rhodococcus qingshengii]
MSVHRCKLWRISAIATSSDRTYAAASWKAPSATLKNAPAMAASITLAAPGRAPTYRDWAAMGVRRLWTSSHTSSSPE